MYSFREGIEARVALDQNTENTTFQLNNTNLPEEGKPSTKSINRPPVNAYHNACIQKNMMQNGKNNCIDISCQELDN